MIDKLLIKNFKCFETLELNLKKLTVLAGSNSVGKTSVIQALLLSKLAIDCFEVGSVLYDGSAYLKESQHIPLNGEYLLSLGNTLEVLNRNANTNKISFYLEDSQLNSSITLEYLANDTRDDYYELELLKSSFDKGNFNGISKEFYYLNAERLGPRLSYDVDQLKYPHVGWQGEYTIQVLSQKKEESIENIDRRFPLSENDNKVLNQVRDWMAYIIPGFYIDDAILEGKLKKAHTSYSKSSPTNVGFGISYVLPIVVNGLIAKDNSLFIVENPEAHLHPKGQSNIGYFLGLLASAGLQVIIETHSEHVINGIRRALLSSVGPGFENFNIPFFKNRNSNTDEIYKEIFVSPNGDLTDFPKDFFDQVNQDLAELFKMRNRRKNG